jgi:uncharacterized membrane-anchored protein YitT (DUF2179 family)
MDKKSIGKKTVDRKSVVRQILSVLCVLAGNALYALTVKLFLLPSDVIVGGTTGISLFVEHTFGVSISLFILIFNILMLIVGLIILGKKFALTTIISSFAYPVFLELFNHCFGDLVLTTDPFLSTLFSGLGIGIALGVVIRSGASTGGMDIPPLVLNRFFKIPVSVSLYVFDFCILILQFSFTPIDKILYGIVLTLIYTVVLDKILLKGTSKTEVKVISQKTEEIRSAILSQLDRGVTILYGEGGYLQEKSQILMSVISNREVIQIERLIHQIDPECFMVVSRVSEVSGRGFSMKKKYR